MEHITTDIWLVILSALKILTLVFGATFVVYALRAWLKHRTRSMILLAFAIGILTVAIFTEGVVFWLTGGNLDAAHIVEAAIALIGFVVLLSSVVVARKDQSRRARVAQTPHEWEDEEEPAAGT